MGFWCVNRVIERHATRPQNRHEIDPRADAVIDCDPTEARNHLAPVGSAVFAFSERVDRITPPPSTALIETLTRVTSGKTSVAASWQDWKAIVQRDRPNLLVLLSHTIEDEEFDQPGLEIGTDDQLLAAHLDATYVRSADCTSPPVVLLLGCETALSDQPFEQFMTGFQQQGASIVVGTLATVLGYHAAPVAAALVEAIAVAAASSDATFGDVLTETRRKLLAQGLVMAMTLTAYGDADWRFTTSEAPA
jgi:hypothetical protein